MALAALLVGCSANTVEGAAEGAAVGAVSAGMLGALTDLIVDGEVNTYRLSRNVTAGALAGGATGAISGANKDEQQVKATQPAAPSKPALNFGPDVDASVNALISCDYDTAFRSALSAEQASQESYKEAGLAMQALIDFDRNNQPGVDRAVTKFVSISQSLNSVETANTQLKALHDELIQERQIAGKPTSCR
jgi:hypothetical protein